MRSFIVIKGKGEAKGEIKKERGRNRMGGRSVCLFKRTGRKRMHEWVEGGACLLKGLFAPV